MPFVGLLLSNVFLDILVLISDIDYQVQIIYLRLSINCGYIFLKPFLKIYKVLIIFGTKEKWAILLIKVYIP